MCALYHHRPGSLTTSCDIQANSLRYRPGIVERLERTHGCFFFAVHQTMIPSNTPSIMVSWCMTPLDGAYKRVNRAREHLDELKREIDAFSQNCIHGVSVDYQRIRSPIDRSEFTDIRNVRRRPVPVPQEFGVLVGEIIYNLRAALDYLVYELARFDAKHEIEGTQFPIEDSAKRFEDRICTVEDKQRGRYLRGVSSEHTIAIKKLQPFNGCHWTRQLRDISNPDKHRRLTVVDSPVVVGSEVDATEALSADRSLNVTDICSFEVIFQDGTPVIETLEQFLFRVVETLDGFKPEFKQS